MFRALWFSMFLVFALPAGSASAITVFGMPNLVFPDATTAPTPTTRGPRSPSSNGFSGQ